MISEIQASAAVIKAKEGEGITLEFTETGHATDKVRVILQEVGLVGLEQQVKEAIEMLGLDREQLLKSVDLKYFLRM